MRVRAIYNHLILWMLLIGFCLLAGCGRESGAVSAANDSALAIVRVYYVETDTGKELAQPEQITDPVSVEVHALTRYHEIAGYAFQKASADKVTASAGESKTLFLYYVKSNVSSAPAPLATLTVRHLDRADERSIVKDEIITSSEKITAKPDTYVKSLSGYTYLQASPAEGMEVEAGKSGVLILYYKKSTASSSAGSGANSPSSVSPSSAVQSQASSGSPSKADAQQTKVIVRFFAEGSQNPIADPVTITGEGSVLVKISQQVKTIPGYTYISSSPSTDFTVKSGQTGELILYYAKKVMTSATALYPSSPGIQVIRSEKGWVDVSNASQGYITAKFTGDSTKKAKLQVAVGSHSYYYDIDRTGKVCTYPLQWGNGTYTFKMYEQKSGSEYYTVLSGTAAVEVENEFLPFLYPMYMIHYTAASSVTAKAAELCANATDDFDRLKAVFDFVTANIKYDDAKAASVQPGYVPDLDSILASKKGICYDYAAMTAAMLRSQGVPTRMVFGYVAPNSISHAWNEVYIEGKGWITAKIFIESKTWKLMDTTFLAAGVNNSNLVNFVGNGSNYTKQEIF